MNIFNVDHRVLARLVLVIVVLVSSGCASLPLIGINTGPGNSLIPIRTDIVATVPACQQGGYVNATECQRGYNQEQQRIWEEGRRLIEDQARDWYDRAYYGTKYSPSEGRVVHEFSCAGAPSAYARDECFRGLQDGVQNAHAERRQWEQNQRQNAYDHGAGVARGSLRSGP